MDIQKGMKVRRGREQRIKCKRRNFMNKDCAGKSLGNLGKRAKWAKDGNDFDVGAQRLCPGRGTEAKVRKPGIKNASKTMGGKPKGGLVKQRAKLLSKMQY